VKLLIDDITISPENFQNLSSYFENENTGLDWNLIFTIPDWLKVWWQSFGTGADLLLFSVKRAGRIIGIAPLQVRNRVASIIGNSDVCDYQDFIVVPGFEEQFYTAVLEYLQQKEVKELHLETVRPDSNIARKFIPLLNKLHYRISEKQVDVSSDIDLPASWDEYLSMLNRKQRHELRRKMRNISEIGQTDFVTIRDSNGIPEAVQRFLNLFPESRGDKAQFMTAEMQEFFRLLSLSLAEPGVIGFSQVELAGKPLAMVMFFDYNSSIYLYNSAYDPAYRSMSVGIISKAGCIRESIEKGKKKFDFLKGPEQYKYNLGGKEIPLFAYHITAPAGGLPEFQ